MFHTNSNNFFNSNGPLRGEKTTLYEGGLRVPMIARFPGRIEPDTVSDLQIYFPDIMPTLADFAGATDHVPGDIDGLSFAPELQGKAQQPHEFLYWEYHKYNWSKRQYFPTGPMQAVRMGKWKAVRTSITGKFELYDLSVDLGETTNIADKHPDIIAKIEQIAKTEHADPVPQTEPEMPPGKMFR